MVRLVVLAIALNDARHGTAENRGGDSGRFEEKGGRQCRWGGMGGRVRQWRAVFKISCFQREGDGNKRGELLDKTGIEPFVDGDIKSQESKLAWLKGSALSN